MGNTNSCIDNFHTIYRSNTKVKAKITEVSHASSKNLKDIIEIYAASLQYEYCWLIHSNMGVEITVIYGLEDKITNEQALSIYRHECTDLTKNLCLSVTTITKTGVIPLENSSEYTVIIYGNVVLYNDEIADRDVLFFKLQLIEM